MLRASKSNDPDDIRNWSSNWVAKLVEGSGVEIAPPLPVPIDGWIRNEAEFMRGISRNLEIPKCRYRRKDITLERR